MTIAVAQQPQEKNKFLVDYRHLERSQSRQQQIGQLEHHGAQLISELEKRICHLEGELTEQVLQNNKQAMEHEGELYQAIRAKEQAEKRADLLSQQFQERCLQLRQFQEQQQQEQDLTEAQRAQIGALQGQVRELRDQLQVSTQRVEALEEQIQRIDADAAKRQKEFLDCIKQIKQGDALISTANWRWEYLAQKTTDLKDGILDLIAKVIASVLSFIQMVVGRFRYSSLNYALHK